MTDKSAPVAGDRRYYLDDYSDEHVPCDCTLAGWAVWLAEPSEEWNRNEAAADGETFRASVLRFEEDIVATFTGGEWQLSREVEGAALYAVRFSAGWGWDAEAICADMAGVREYLADGEGGEGDTEFVAVAFDEPDVLVTFRAGPPPICSAEVIQ